MKLMKQKKGGGITMSFSSPDFFKKKICYDVFAKQTKAKLSGHHYFSLSIYPSRALTHTHAIEFSLSFHSPSLSLMCFVCACVRECLRGHGEPAFLEHTSCH